MKTTRRIRTAVVLTFAAASLAIFLALLNIAGGLSLGAKYRFEAVVPNAVELVPGGDVREAGINVGTVTGISNRGASAVIDIALNHRYGPVYRDATVRVATKTLVGENYIDLDPGRRTAGAIPAGGILPIAQAQDSIQLDQILSTFPRSRQARLRQLLAGLGGGLANSGQQLNQTLDALAGTATAAAPVAQALSDQSQQLDILVSDLGQVFGALGQRTAQIQSFVTDGTATARAVAARDAALRSGLHALPGTIATVQRVAGHLARVGRSADPVLGNLGGALTALTPALRALPGAGAATIAALNRLHAVTPVATRLVTALSRTAPALERFVPPLAGIVNQLRPLVGFLGPYATDATHLLYEMDSVGIAHDATGLLVRLDGALNANSLVNLPSADKTLLNKVLGAGLGSVVTLKGVNQYPAPGTFTTPAPLSGSYPLLKADRGG